LARRPPRHFVAGYGMSEPQFLFAEIIRNGLGDAVAFIPLEAARVIAIRRHDGPLWYVIDHNKEGARVIDCDDIIDCRGRYPAAAKPPSDEDIFAKQNAFFAELRELVANGGAA
jgi:hypothetical protein